MICLEDEVRRLFWRYPDDDSTAIRKKILHPEQGPYWYFRRIKTAIQARFAELMDHSTLPQVFLHGSPHLDNYAQTLSGAGIIDFDRAHIGPYAWDIVCLLLSLSLRAKKHTHKFLGKEITNALSEGYLEGFHFPEMGYRLYTPLTRIKPKNWELTTKNYLEENKKWAKKLREFTISTTDPVGNEVLLQYLASRDEVGLLDTYKIHQMARTHGTFGRIRFLISLMPHDPVADAILLDIKETRSYLIPAWTHTIWYTHNFDHEAKRMIAASKLYTPKCDFREGYATVNGVEYWGRQIPTFNRKPAKSINRVAKLDFALSAGSQLGRGHRLSLQNIEPNDFIKIFTRQYSEIIDVADRIHGELLCAWQENINAFKNKKDKPL